MKKSLSPKHKKPPRMSRRAARMLAVGHMGILLCLCLLWILLDSPLRGEAILYADAYARSVGGFGVILWVVALGIDWLERFYRPK